MARIAGVDLPRNKHANIALTYIYGIAPPAPRAFSTRQKWTDEKVSTSPKTRSTASPGHEAEGSVEGDLRRTFDEIKRLIEIGSIADSVIAQPARTRAAHPHQCRTRKVAQGTVAQKRRRQKR